MAALYAFCREVDDVADDESVPAEKRQASLAAWREDVRRACDSGAPEFVVNRELQPVIARHHLPFAHFDELIRGVEMDLDIKRYQTYDELEQYCYRVASVVRGLWSERFEQAAESTAREARKFYSLARQTLPKADRRSMVAAELMGSVYWRLLRKLEGRRFQVFGPRPTRLGKGQKTLLIFRTWCRLILGVTEPGYGIP